VETLAYALPANLDNDGILASSLRAAVTGTLTVGSTLTATLGTWSGGALTFGRQWQSSADGTTWTDISGATARTYVLTASESGKYLRCAVTATNSFGATSYATPAVGTVS